MPEENPPKTPAPATTSSIEAKNNPPSDNPVDRYSHGDPGLLAEAMLAPGEREPDIDPSVLDPDALRVIRGLRTEGFQAYLVGGCVRDLLLDRQPKDFDIATSAHPGEMRALFRNCRLIGRRFRLAHVYFRGNKIIEVATFRRNPNPALLAADQAEAAEAALAAAEESGELPNGPAADAEAESEVEVEAEMSPDLLITEDNTFGTAEEDARRRDFTINGLFYDVTLGRVLDYVGGLRDLDRALVRTIGDPEVRLREDPVRLLRAVRFACKLGFDIEPVTYAACEGAVEDLPRCAPPRLLDEIFKILRGGASAPAFKLLDALGAVPVLLPALNAAMKAAGPDAGEKIGAMLARVDERMGKGTVLDDALIFAALLEPVTRGREESTEGLSSIDGLLDQLVRTSRLPRRIADRVRHLLAAQQVLSGERRRRRSLASFRRTPYFSDALALFELRAEATGEGETLLERWRSGGEIELPPKAGEASGAPGELQKKRRRRRRRRSEGMSSESGSALDGTRSTEPASASASASAPAPAPAPPSAPTEAKPPSE
jgi:poly(A) polymerase